VDKLTAQIVALAIICGTGIALVAMFQLTTASAPAKEVAILAITAIFSAISGGGIGIAVGSKMKGGTSDEEGE